MRKAGSGLRVDGKAVGQHAIFCPVHRLSGLKGEMTMWVF